MLRQDYILCKTRNLLSVFLTPMMGHTDRPRQRFLRQTIGAILISGTLVITDLAPVSEATLQAAKKKSGHFGPPIVSHLIVLHPI
ncbi:hypothetical protein ACQ9LF_13740 [Anaerohalosphaeraceae bacterium U12dextr]